jgi:DNA-binding LacI/PurR family transcriptional regulator
VTSPELTTVRMPTREFGRHAARLLLLGAGAVPAGDTPDLATRLIVRASCAPPRA